MNGSVVTNISELRTFMSFLLQGTDKERPSVAWLSGYKRNDTLCSSEFLRTVRQPDIPYLQPACCSLIYVELQAERWVRPSENKWSKVERNFSFLPAWPRDDNPSLGRDSGQGVTDDRTDSPSLLSVCRTVSEQLHL